MLQILSNHYLISWYAYAAQAGWEDTQEDKERILSDNSRISNNWRLFSFFIALSF